MESPIHAPEGAESVPDPLVEPVPAWSAEPIPAAATAASEIRYGGFWRRTGAFFLDLFVISIVSVPATILTLTAYGSALSTIVTIVTGILGLAYAPFCWTRWGMTVGFALMGLRVVRLEDLQRISWWRALGRLFALYPAASFFGLGILWVGWEPRKRGWHDRLADTLVLRVPSLGESHDPRRTWAIAATIVGAASWIFSLVVGITVGISIATHGFRDAHGELVGSQLLGISALQPGDCFDPFFNTFDSVTATRCTELHVYEVFATAELRAGSFPSEEEMQELASETCIPAFDPYVGISFELSTLFVGYLGPEQGSWLIGERTLTCYLSNEAQTRTRGSARGSAN